MPNDDYLTKKLTPRAKKLLEGARRELKLRPEVSDEEFMAETEASDEQYRQGFGLIMSADEKPISTKQLAEEGYMHDFEWNDSLFSGWLHEGVHPDKLAKGFEDMAPAYAAWLKEHNLTPGQ